jgi:methyltransferase
MRYTYVHTHNVQARIDHQLEPGVRVTVKLDPGDTDPTKRSTRGTAVAPSVPREERGLYWGYSTRLAASLSEVLTSSPYSGGYDLTVGTSERGKCSVDDADFALRPFKHALVVFGGVLGIEAR